AELDRGRAEIEQINREHERRAAELDVAAADLVRRLAEVDRLRGELERARAAVAAAPVVAAVPAAQVVSAAQVGQAAQAAPFALALGDGDAGARLALRLAGPATALAHGDLDVRLQLHRTAAYPVISLTIGRPASLRGAGHVYATALLDLAVELDRKVLVAL